MHPPSSLSPANQFVGIGLRPPHAAALRALRPSLGFLEVHTGQAHLDDGAGPDGLLAFRSLYAIGLHDDGLIVGSAADMDEARLAELARLVDQIEPVRVSLHHRPSTHPLGEAELALWVGGIQQVQDRLGRAIVLGKRSPSHLGHAPADPLSGETGPTPDFLAEVCRRSGCGLLLDLGHLLVDGLNLARRASWQPGAPAFDEAAALRDARARALDFIWSLPPHFIAQFLVAGFRWPEQTAQSFSPDRSQRIAPTLWDIYEQALAHVGERPTLVDWDADLPPLAVLLDEARLAADAITQARRTDGRLDGD